MADFNLEQKPMSVSTAISNIFNLWWKNLNAVIILSITCAALNFAPLYIIKSNASIFHPTEFAVFALAAIINIIPSSAIFAKLGHAVHHQSITFSQSLAVSLLRFPRLLLFYFIIALAFGVPMFILVHLLVGKPAQSILLVIFFLLLILYLILLLTLSVYFTLVTPLIINDNESVISAIKKSIKLIQGGWWFTGLILSVPICIGFLGGVVSKAILGLPGTFLSQALFFPLHIATVIILCEHHKFRSSTLIQSK